MDQALPGLISLKIEFLDEEKIIGTIPYRNETANVVGAMHGGTIYSAGDTLAGAFLWSKSDGNHFAVTKRSEIRYLRPFKKGILCCTVREKTRSGRKVCLEAEFQDEEKRPVSQVEMEFSLVMTGEKQGLPKVLPAIDLKIVQSIRLFRDLTDATRDDVIRMSQSLRREKDKDFFRQGESARSFFVLRRGRIKVSQITSEGHQIVVRYVGPGEMFGCVPLYGGKEYPATATAVSECEALCWDHSSFGRLMERYPRIAINALELVGEELAGVRERYQELATERVEQRVARALLRLVRQAGKKVEGGVLIEFPLSRQDLAELTGTTLHTVSRILSAWEQKKIIKSGRKKIIICRPHGLVSLAEDL